MTRSVCAAVWCCLVSVPVFAQPSAEPLSPVPARSAPGVTLAAAEQPPVTAVAASSSLRDAVSKRPAALFPMYVSLGALHTVDIVSTMRALSSGAGREANPVMRSVVGNRAAFVAVKVGTLAGTIWMSERTRKKHPVLAVVLMAASNATMTAIVAHNYSIK